MSTFGQDPMDTYTYPLKEENRGICTLFQLKPRGNEMKPGRKLLVSWDERRPLVEGFVSKYTYHLTFEEVGNTAGNHFHQVKQEIFIPARGAMRVRLQDKNNPERTDLIILRDSSPMGLYVPAGIAHSVEALEVGSVLLVHATSPNTVEDEFHHDINL